MTTGTCPECGEEVSLDGGGCVVVHRLYASAEEAHREATAGTLRAPCLGSEQRPVEQRQAVAA